MRRVVKPLVIAIMCAEMAVVATPASAALTTGSQNTESASWYYVDANGVTKGPLPVAELSELYAAGDVKATTYVWNGGSVNQWTALGDVAELSQQLMPAVDPISGDSPYEGGYLYYVDPGGKTRGPTAFGDARALYAAGWINDATYVWDGAAIAQWTSLSALPQILAALKEVPATEIAKKRSKKTTTKTRATKKKRTQTTRVPPTIPKTWKKKKTAKKGSTWRPVPKGRVRNAVTDVARDAGDSGSDASTSVAEAAIWYYVDAHGTTKGPVTVSALRELYKGGDVNAATPVWNGGTVNQWTALSDLESMLGEFTADVQPIAGDSAYESGYLYYVDPGGHTRGPESFAAMRGLYAAGWVTAATYVWDGAAIGTWTQLSHLPSILAQLQKVPPRSKRTMKKSSTKKSAQTKSSTEKPAPTKSWNKKKKASNTKSWNKKKKASNTKSWNKKRGTSNRSTRVPPQPPKKMRKKKRGKSLPPLPKRPVPKPVTKRRTR